MPDHAGTILLQSVLTLAIAAHLCTAGLLFWKVSGILLQHLGHRGFFPPSWIPVPQQRGAWPELRPGFLIAMALSPLLALRCIDLLYAPEFLTRPLLWGLPALVLLGGVALRGAALRVDAAPEAKGGSTKVRLLGGLVILGAEMVLFLALISLFSDPEKWPFVQQFPWLLIRSNALTATLLYPLLPLAVLSCGSLYFQQADQRTSLLPTLMAIACSVLVPPLLLLDLATLPGVALSPLLYAQHGLTVLLAGLLALGALLFLWKSYRFLPGVLVTLSLSLLLLVCSSRPVAMASALEHQGRAEVLVKIDGDEEKPRERAASAQAEGEGQRIFDQVCAGCHSWESRVVGPPLASVLPGYRNSPEKLDAFLRNPVKVNPEYPPMPDPGLSEEEIAAVRRYLLERLSQEGAEP